MSIVSSLAAAFSLNDRSYFGEQHPTLHIYIMNKITDTENPIAIDYIYDGEFQATNLTTNEVTIITKEFANEVACFDNVFVTETARVNMHAVDTYEIFPGTMEALSHLTSLV